MRLSLAAAAMAAAVSCTAAERSPLAPSAAEPVPLIVAFGDSLTAGPGLREDQTYPAVLQRRIDAAGYRYRVVNAGVSGETTTDGLRRFERALVPDAQILILAMGANDGLRGVPLDTIRRNLSSMVRSAQARGVRVLLCGIDTPPVHGFRYSVDFHFIFPELAAEHGVPLVPFMLEGVLGRPELNLGDGIHPNAEGAAVVAANIWAHLEPMLSVQTVDAR